MAYQYAEKNGVEHPFNRVTQTAGRPKEWIRDFCGRERLSLSASSLSAYEKYHFLPTKIFNMEETGIATVPNKLPKVLSPRGKRTVCKVVSGERGQLVTAVCCIDLSASGSYIVYVPPALIFPRKTMKAELYTMVRPQELCQWHQNQDS